MQSITPFLWFDGRAEEAMNFSVSIFKNSKRLQMPKIDIQALQRASEQG
jgi:predicted 3-demethylubiquinone-9 3-methyltransferase (glyoxalase superfamily)